MNKMNPTEFVQSTINSSSMSMNEWSKELGVSRQAIYNWLGNINIKIRKILIQLSFTLDNFLILSLIGSIKSDDSHSDKRR